MPSRSQNELAQLKQQLRTKGEKLTFEELDLRPSPAPALIDGILSGMEEKLGPGTLILARTVVGWETLAPGWARCRWQHSGTTGDGPGSGAWILLEAQLQSKGGKLSKLRSALENPPRNSPSHHLTNASGAPVRDALIDCNV